MRILIQNKETAFFFKDGAVWASDYETALDFQTIRNAVQFCASQHLKNVHILLKSRNGEQEIILPIPDAAAA